MQRRIIGLLLGACLLSSVDSMAEASLKSPPADAFIPLRGATGTLSRSSAAQFIPLTRNQIFRMGQETKTAPETINVNLPIEKNSVAAATPSTKSRGGSSAMTDEDAKQILSLFGSSN